MCRRRKQSIPRGVYIDRWLKGVCKCPAQPVLQNPNPNKWVSECLDPKTWIKSNIKES